MEPVWISLGIDKTKRSLWILGIGDKARAEIDARANLVKVDAWTIIELRTAARFADELRHWMFDVAGIVGAEATHLIRDFGASMSEMLESVK